MENDADHRDIKINLQVEGNSDSSEDENSDDNNVPMADDDDNDQENL